MLADLFAARWLGHGRAVECFLALTALLYGALLLLMPSAAFDSRATADIAWQGYGQFLAGPLLIKAWLTGTGLLMNITAHPGSRQLRFAGAFLGFLIWSWCVTKFVLVGAIATIGFPFTLMAALFSIRIMGLALADLPLPGAPGRL